MYAIVKYISKPVMKDPWFIEALPGIGNVGKIAGDHLAQCLGAERFAIVYSENFPPQVVPDRDCVVHMACNELWHAKTPSGRDIIFLRGDYQGSTPEGQFFLALDIMDVLLGFGVERIITLGGFGTGQMSKEEPHVFGAVSRIELKRELEKAGVAFNPGQPSAGIIGAAGALVGLGQMNDIDAFCLMGETSGYFADCRSAIKVLKVLKKLLKLRKLDLKPLETEAKKLDEFIDQAEKQSEAPEERDELSYIG